MNHKQVLAAIAIALGLSLIPKSVAVPSERNNPAPISSKKEPLDFKVLNVEFGINPNYDQMSANKNIEPQYQLIIRYSGPEIISADIMLFEGEQKGYSAQTITIRGYNQNEKQGIIYAKFNHKTGPPIKAALDLVVIAGEDKKISFSYEELTNMQGKELRGEYIVIERVGLATKPIDQSKEEELISCNNPDIEQENGTPYEVRIATRIPEFKDTLEVIAIKSGKESDPINIKRNYHTIRLGGNESFFMRLSSCFEGKPNGFLFVLKQIKRKLLGPYVLSL